MIRTLIVDDEPLAREGIRTRLELERDFDIIGEAGDGQEAIDAILALLPDLVFLDVQMPGLTGFDVLDRVASEHLPVVIFVTAHDEYALKAFEAHALDYVLKPVESKRFAEVLKRARREISNADTLDTHLRIVNLLDAPRTNVTERIAPPSPGWLRRMPVKNGDRYLLVEVGSIDWFESAGNYVRLHVGSDAYLTRGTLKELTERLDPEMFTRIHRSTIVNITHVKEIRSEWHGDFDVELNTGAVLRMSRTYRDSLLA